MKEGPTPGPGPNRNRPAGPSGRAGRRPTRPKKPPKFLISQEERSRAEALATRSGIPVEQAVLVVKGRKTLNQVLHEMLAFEKRDRLIREGLDRKLAGMVAVGRLPLARARQIQELWNLQNAPFKSERLQDSVKEFLAFSLFGEGVVGGVVRAVQRYEVVVRDPETAQDRTVKKHDIRFYCKADQVAEVLMRLGRNTEIARLGLGSSLKLEDRFRPTEDLALQWLRSARRVLFQFRDGYTLAGVVRRVAVYEVDLEVAPGVTACILTHALFKPNPYISDLGNDD